MALVLISTIEDPASGIKLEIWAEDDGNGGVNFKIESVGTNQADYDLNGFFVDVGNDGGSITSVGSKSNNMNGSSADGEKLDGFDYAAALGSVGGKDADWNEGTFNIAGLKFEDLDGAQLGIRATSVGADGEGSLKLVGDAEIPDEEPDDHFPDFKEETGHSISHVTFYFDTPDGFLGDTVGIVGDKGANDPDGWFTVKFNDEATPELSDDLDDWYDDALAYIIAQNPTLDPSTLVGVSIKGSTEEIWYDIDNDPDDVDTPPDVWKVENKEVDQAYDVTVSDPFTVA